MILGHSQPEGVVWTVDGTAAILSPTDWLMDNRPDTLCRFSWITGAQTTLSVTKIRAEWPNAITPRAVSMLNIKLPDGLLIRTNWRRSSDPAGTYPYHPTSYNSNQRSIMGPRGEVTRWELLAAGADPCVGMEIELVNNVNGLVGVTAGRVFEIGDIGIWQGNEFEIDRKWGIGWTDPTSARFDSFNQPHPTLGFPARTFKWKFPLEWFDNIFSPASTSLESLIAKMDRGQVCAYIPRYTDDGVFNEHRLHRTAMIGMATDLPDYDHEAGQYFSNTQIVVKEIPIPT